MSPRGRGRPVSFDQAARDRYLAAVAAGLPLADAAHTAGITPQWANRVAATDPSFDTARQLAKKQGKQARVEALPHDEYRYIHHGCRCTDCTAAATTARTARRHRDDPDTPTVNPPPPRQVIDLPQHPAHHGPSEAPLLLARTS